MKRLVLTFGFIGLGLFVGVATAFAQGGTTGDGFPPQSALYADAVWLARLLPFVIALGIGFGIWQAKVRSVERKSSPDSPSVIRHDWGVVIQHWSNAIGFFIGMITGFMLLRWLPYPSDVRSIFIIHYIGSAFVLFGVASHLTQHGITGGLGLIPRRFKDVNEALGELTEYAGLYGPDGAAFHLNLPKGLRQTFGETFRAFGFRPPQQLGKYLPAEKVLSYTPWAIIVGTMVVTGLIKSFRYLYPIPPTFIATVSTLHDYSAYASVVMLVIHLCAVLLIPRHWPLVVSIFTTRIPRAFVEKYHSLWYKDLVAQEQASTSVAPATTVAKPVQTEA